MVKLTTLQTYHNFCCKNMRGESQSSRNRQIYFQTLLLCDMSETESYTEKKEPLLDLLITILFLKDIVNITYCWESWHWLAMPALPTLQIFMSSWNGMLHY